MSVADLRGRDVRGDHTMRLHELAKEIGAESKLLLALAKELGLKARNHSATLTVGEIALLKAAYREEHGDSTPPPVAAVEVAPADAAKAEPRKRRMRVRTSENEGEATEGDGDSYESVPGESGFEGSSESESSSVSAPEPVAPVAAAPTAPPSPAPQSAAPPVARVEPPAAPASVAPEAEKPAVAPAHVPAAKPKESHPSEPVRPAAAAVTPAAPVPPAPPRTPSPSTAPPSPSHSAPPARPSIAARGPIGSLGSMSGANLPGGRTVRGGPVAPPPPRTNDPSSQHGAPGGQGGAGTAATGAAPQSPIKRPSRPAGGAKILGRIELPREELERQRQMRTAPGPTTTNAPGASPDAGAAAARGPGRGPILDPITEAENAKKRGIRGRSDSAAWNPDDEDDPLLQSIRLRQAANSLRRPPRRVGPRKAKKPQAPPVPTGPLEVAVPISVRDLSSLLGAKVSEILRILLGGGHEAGVNSALNEMAVLEVAAARNREVNIVAKQNLEQTLMAKVDAMDKKLAAREETGRLQPRPPVVAFLGHVDHGKTSLLDRIRNSNVAAGEAGGITQSMRAYSVTSPTGHKITLLDTPGHKAFTEMRARGANVTDIVVLVVAADDGVMPQTEEAIQHAKAAKCPIVVALNKIDRGEANADRVMQQLATAGVLVEAWGGDVQVAKTSATTGRGIDELLEKITLQAEVMDLKADPTREARGTVIEARKDDQLGAIATVLVQEGTFRVGDVMLSGTSYGRIRKLIADDGTSITEAAPSTPVNVLGLNDPPDASAPFFVLESLKQAREVAEERLHSKNKDRVTGPSRNNITLENLFANLEAGKAEEVLLIVRCDVKGSLEVVKKELESLSKKEVKIKIIRDALGGITEDDVLLAIASEATIIGFNVVADDKARSLADQRGVDIRTYEIIYQLVDDVKAAMEGKLSPIQKEAVIGHVEIREIFKVSKVGTIAGCIVKDGIVKRNAKIRLTRDGRIVHTGKLASLKRFKDDVREVKEGLECGLKVDGYDDIKVGDIVEAFEVAEEKRTLDFSAGAS